MITSAVTTTPPVWWPYSSATTRLGDIRHAEALVLAAVYGLTVEQAVRFGNGG